MRSIAMRSIPAAEKKNGQRAIESERGIGRERKRNWQRAKEELVKRKRSTSRKVETGIRKTH